MKISTYTLLLCLSGAAAQAQFTPFGGAEPWVQQRFEIPQGQFGQNWWSDPEQSYVLTLRPRYAQDLMYPPNYSLGFQSQCNGCDQQVVSTQGVRDAFGRLSGASAWLANLNESEASQLTDNAMICDAAIDFMFKALCDGESACEIEQRYSEKCAQPGLSEIEIAECTTIERNYVDACFVQKQCSPRWPNINTYGSATVGFVVNANDEPVCTASAFSYPEAPSRDTPSMVATAQHCLTNNAFRVRSIRGRYIFNGPSEDIAPLMDETAKVNVGQSGIYLSDLTVGAPELFAPTYFIAFNEIAYARHLMALKNDLSDLSGNYLLCDASPRCTVVTQVGNRLQHTCQSTVGSSGGALIQYRPLEGKYVIVGINDGAESAGVVNANIAYTLPDLN